MQATDVKNKGATKKRETNGSTKTGKTSEKPILKSKSGTTRTKRQHKLSKKPLTRLSPEKLEPLTRKKSFVDVWVFINIVKGGIEVEAVKVSRCTKLGINLSRNKIPSHSLSVY